MRADHDRGDALGIAALYNALQRISRAVMQGVNALALGVRHNRRLVVERVSREERVEDLRRGRRRMIKPRGAKPFAEAVVAVDLWLGAVGTESGELVERGVQGLDASVERAGVEALDGRI